MFTTLLNCIDGRAQLPALEFLKEKFNSGLIDNITEPGIVSSGEVLDAILSKIEISMSVHKSKTITVAAHHDCAGNSLTETEQKAQLKTAKEFLQKRYESIEIHTLWIDENFIVKEV
ncbi:MAG: carbonic anhydrase [Planctomycetota bacterium]|jgi:carbonic anhydrase